MNIIKFDEEKLEKSVIGILKDIGYEHNYGLSIKRDSDKEVLIKEDLEKYLSTNYTDLTANEINKILFELESFSSNDLYETNKKFYQLIVNGKILRREDPQKKDLHLNLINKQSKKNIYKVVNQFKIVGKEKRIPDLIIYINGIPVVLFEFKSAIKVNTNIYDAYRQIKIRYKRDIPEIFKYNLFCIISDGVDNRSGSIFTTFENFYSWRRSNLDNKSDAEGINSLKTLLDGMLNKNDLINIIFDFIYFPDNSDEDEKILCRYPQFYGALRLFDNIQKNLKPNGSGKGGTYFGATGCGKSHTMLFLSRLIMKNKSLESPTIIFITDRTDLDDQLTKLFENSKKFLLDDNVSSVETRNDLREKLKNRKSGGIFLTTIQKFSEDIGLLSDRNNIIVIADEAHRTQLNIEEKIQINENNFKSRFGFAKYLRDSFPNATYVGFTGTPIDETINIFGPVVETYTMTDSVDDKITVPLVREDRVAKVWGDHNKIIEIEKYYDDLVNEGANIYQIEHSKKANAKMKTVLGDEDRLDKLAIDFVDHYEKKQNERSTYHSKAMFVSSSREIAYKLYKKIIKLKPEWTKILQSNPGEELSRHEKNKIKPSEKIKLVMTRDKDDEKELYDLLGTKEYRKELDRQFKQEKSNFKIAIVVDMWITGFNVKFLDTIYIDKPIEKHNLIQTISRVNRKDTPETNNELINEIKKKKLIFPFVIDNYMTIGSFINEINQNFKYIIVMKNPIDLVFSWYRSGRGSRLGTDPYYIKPSFQINGLDNIHYTMLATAEEFNHANSLEKCFLIVEKQLTEYLNSKLLHSKNSCLVPFENYSIETEKYIQKFENLLDTSRTEFTSTEMIKANLPRKKDISTFSKKINMIFDNMDEKYIHRLKNLCLRYETEISDVYKISSATKYLKGKFKGISIDEFSKVSAHSKYHEGKRIADEK